MGYYVKEQKWNATPLSEPERQLLVPYSTKANAFCELGRKKIGKNEPCSPQKAFAFVEFGTRSCLSGSDRGVVSLLWEKKKKSANECLSGLFASYDNEYSENGSAVEITKQD